MNIRVKSLRALVAALFASIVTATFLLRTNQDEILRESDSQPVFRVPFIELSAATSYDPKSIKFLEEYNLLENLFSTLIELGPNGEHFSGLAAEFGWSDGSAFFAIRADAKSIDGVKITAVDAAASLRRLLVNPSNTHGSLKDILCPDETLDSVDHGCEGIRVEGNTLWLTPKRSPSFLMPLLAVQDFSIIPRSSLDAAGRTIANYRQTSGPYFVERDFDGSAMILAANPNHWHWSPAIPQRVELVRSSLADQDRDIEKFARGELAYVPKFSGVKREDIAKLARVTPSVSTHATLNVGVRLALFTRRGRQRLSQCERLVLGSAMRSAFYSYFEREVPGLYELTEQFFLPLADGALSPDERASLSSVQKRCAAISAHDGVYRVGVYASMKDQVRAILSSLPYKFEISEFADSHAFEAPDADLESMPDVIVIVQDTTAMEDIANVSYTINSGTFGLTKPERVEWLSSYFGVNEKEERLKLLRDLHLKALIEPIVVPLVALPYLSAVHAPWTLHHSRITPSDALWLIKKPI